MIDSERKQLLFFQNPIGAWFIRPTSIPVILEIAISNEVDPSITALYLWSYSEAADWYEYEPAQFDVDQIDFTSSDKPHAAEYCSKVRELFQPVSFTVSPTETDLKEITSVSQSGLSNVDGAERKVSLSSRVLESDSEPKSLGDRSTSDSVMVVEVTANIKLCTDSETDSKYFSSLQAGLTKVEHAWHEHLSKINKAKSAITELQNMPASTKKISNLETLVSAMNVGWKSVLESIDSYCSLFQESLKHLGQQTIGHEVLVTTMELSNVQDIEKWLSLKANDLEVFIECEKTLIRYRDFSTKLNTYGIPAKWEGPFEGLSTLIDWLNMSIETGEQQYRDMERIENFKRHCAESSMDLNWNPFKDDTLGHGGWIALCSPLNKNMVTPHLVGLALRKLLDADFTKYGPLIDDVLNDWCEDLERTCKILSMLSNMQLEQLWDDNFHMRPALSMCMLNSWLIACDNTDSSAVDFWYLKPLKEASARLDELNIHVCKSVNNFLLELKLFVMQGANCSSGSIQRIISDLDDGVKASKVWVDQLYDQVVQRVIVQPNYTGNYERLAVRAYEALFFPLRDAVVAREPDVVRCKYHVIRAQFDYGVWFASNSGKIESHYIASEHKKKIQQYIDDRFDCLDKWLDAEFDITSELDVQIRKVQNAAVELLEQYEQRNSHSPEEYLLTIGWWLNELRHNVIPPVISSGNPADPLDNSSATSALINEHEFPWRCIEAQVKRSKATWDKYVADALSLWSNPDIETSVIQQWQIENRIEFLRAYVQRSEERGNIDLRELTQWLEEQEVELKRSLEWDFKDIQSKLEGFQSEMKPLYQEELDNIKQCFNSKNWFDLVVRTQSLREEVQSALEGYGKDEKRQQLCDDICYLGGEICYENDLAELKMQLDELLNAAEGRKVHITILRNLLQLPELPERLREELTNVIRMLNQPRYLPETDRAEWLKCILETAFSPLSEYLSKPNILLPEYRDLLLRLFLSFTQLLMNSEWVLEKNSETEKLLVQVSDQLEKEGSIDSVQSARQFLEWFLVQSENFVAIPTIDIVWGRSTTEREEHESGIFINLTAIDDVSIDKARRVLIDALKSFSVGAPDAPINGNYGNEQIEVALNGQKWAEVAQLCAARVHFEKEEHYSDSFLLGAGISLAHVLGGKDRAEVVEALLFLIDHIRVEGVPKVLYRKSQRTEKNLLGTVAASWLFDREVDDVSSWKFDEVQTRLWAVRLARVLGDNSNDLSIKLKSAVLDSLWDYASAESKWGADFRACLLSICAKGSMLGALIFLLKKEPVRMQEPRAKLFAGLLERATDVPGWERLSGFLESERNKQSCSKPFSLFAEQLLRLSKQHNELPATIEVVGPLEKGDEKNLWIAVVDVIPSVMDPPQDIVLRLPSDSTVLFGSDRHTTQRISGPFLDRKQIRITLNIKDKFGGRIPIEMQCHVKTLQDVQTEYMQTWLIEMDQTDDNFVAPSPSFIEQCFSGFPHTPMRGKDFIPRDADEKTIEDMLFNSKHAGSLWITSPRRSGKTSMLFRILDEFSFVKGRDDIVLYFTLSSTFDSEKGFNSWIWRRILRGTENRELKNFVPNLEEIGAALDSDVEVDIFLTELAEKLLKEQPPGARVYFVIDEIDRFAEMYLAGGLKKEKALAIMWQLRHLISSETSIGIVFAGSHAARRFFIADPSAPFYNSISAINLAPFNVETQQNELRTRDIVQPKSLAASFTISKDTLRHLLRITAGIPYYMKLLAGATFSCATHAQIFPADVNEGVTRMLAKETSIKTIDMLENPGEDELRTLYAESVNEIVLIKGVLLAVANIRSPISGHPVNVGELWSERSPLVVRAGLSRGMIEPALTSARNLGFLKTSSSNEYQVEFTIPLLGESMRKRFNTLWADIEQNLEKIGLQ